MPNTAIPLAVAAAGLRLTLVASRVWLTVIALCLTLIGTSAVQGPFGILSTKRLSVVTAAAGIAQINALSNFAGFPASYLIGMVKSHGQPPLALMPLVLLSGATCVAVLVSGRRATAAAAAQ